MSHQAAHQGHPHAVTRGVTDSGRPRRAYPGWTGLLAGGALVVGVILLTVAGGPWIPVLPRSLAAGGGLVLLSTGLTLGTTVVMFRRAPAATAPALAVLYLVKVVVMGWWLITLGTPAWLDVPGFALAVLVALVISWAVLAPIAWRAGNALGDDYREWARAHEPNAQEHSHDTE